MSTAGVSATFVREHLRARLMLVLLVAVPLMFVIVSSSVLGEFSRALGGSVSGHGATALGAGWAAAFLAGALGFFMVASARGADRRLAAAGFGAARVAAARIGAAVVLALVVSAAAYLTLLLDAGIRHPAHAAVAILGFALIYVGIGALVGALVEDELAGSLLVAFVFLFEAFSGPAMSGGGGLSRVMPTRTAADLLLAAGAGEGSPGRDWIAVGAITVVALAVAFTAFWIAARDRD